MIHERKFGTAAQDDGQLHKTPPMWQNIVTTTTGNKQSGLQLCWEHGCFYQGSEHFLLLSLALTTLQFYNLLKDQYKHSWMDSFWWHTKKNGTLFVTDVSSVFCSLLLTSIEDALSLPTLGRENVGWEVFTRQELCYIVLRNGIRQDRFIPSLFNITKQHDSNSIGDAWEIAILACTHSLLRLQHEECMGARDRILFRHWISLWRAEKWKEPWWCWSAFQEGNKESSPFISFSHGSY